MSKKMSLVIVFLVIIANHTVFSQAITLDAAILNAANEIANSVPKETKVAVVNISSDFSNLSDYIINELIVNLVNIKAFQVVPRSTIELELVNREFDFQMTGYVSDESQKSLGQFLGAGTIITGSITKDSENTYRLILNAIHLENYTYQSSYRASIQNTNQVKTLIARSDSNYYEDYTNKERLGMGSLNIFFGIGSILQKQNIGWIVTGGEILGATFIILGIRPMIVEENSDAYILENAKRTGQIIAGSVVIGASIVFGYIIPFFHHRPNNTNISQNNFPFNFELVSSNNQDINGFGIMYNMKF